MINVTGPKRTFAAKAHATGTRLIAGLSGAHRKVMVLLPCIQGNREDQASRQSLIDRARIGSASPVVARQPGNSDFRVNRTSCRPSATIS